MRLLLLGFLLTGCVAGGANPPDTTRVPDTTDGPDTTRVPDTTDGPDTTRVPDTTDGPNTTEAPGSAEMPDRREFGGDRPVTVDVPEGYDSAVRVPLLVVLAGFDTPGSEELTYSGLGDLVEEAGVLVVAPDGALNGAGEHFWNATDACCAGPGSDVDDVAYLASLIEEISAEWNVDPARVFAFGHSNGGFMAYRLACDRADLVAAVVSVAGATWSDETACDPSQPVSVLQIHGTDDEVVRYAGGRFAAPYPGAAETVAMWAGYDRCTGGPAADSARLDIAEDVAGIDTSIARNEGCPMGIDVELWTIEGGPHVPDLQPEFPNTLWTWLADHPRP